MTNDLTQMIKLDTNQVSELITSMGLNLIGAIAILIIGWVAGKYASKLIHKINTLDATLKSFLGGLAKYLIFIMAIVTVMGQFGVETASLLAVLGAAGLAIGLALQGTLSNVASGVMLLILRPFNVGDYIDANGIGGTVKALGLFATEMATADNVYIFVPNSEIWKGQIKNFSRNQQRRQDIVVGIGYDDDISVAFDAIKTVLDADDRMIRLDDKKPQVMVSNLGESSIDIIIRFWTASSDYWATKWDITKTVKEALDEKGITIPYPQRTITMYNVEGKPPTKKKAEKPDSIN